MDNMKLVIAILAGIILAGGIFIMMNPSNSNPSGSNTANINGSTNTNVDSDAANTYFTNQEWENAVEAYRAITAVEPENNQAWFRLGFSLHQLERFEEAIQPFEEALEHGFFNLQAMLSLARAHSKLGNTDRALQWLREANDAGFAFPQLLETDSDLESIRSDAGYADVVLAAQRNSTPCEFDENYRQFDFWIGEWDVYTPSGQLVGSNKIEKLSNGCALFESWVSSSGSPGHSINYYDAPAGKWRQYWVSSNGGMIPQEGEFRDGAIRMEGRNIQPDGSYQLFRGAWSLLDDGRVRQFLEQSTDEGETWYVWFEGLYQRKENSTETETAPEVAPATPADDEDDLANSQCTSEESRQLDFWVGDWDLAWEDSPGYPASTGKNIISRELGACVIEENFSAPEYGFDGKSVSTYDVNSKLWKQTWVDSSGSYLDFVGGMQDDGTMIFGREFTDANGDLIKQRMIFYNIQENSMEWNWERSTDNGQTWTVVWNIHYSRAN